MTDNNLTHLTNVRVVRISPTYVGFPSTMPNTDDGRTFYGFDGEFAPGHVTLVVPESDPRSRGMWTDSNGLVLPYRGWHVPAQFVTDVPDTTTLPPVPSPEDRLPVGERLAPFSDVPTNRHLNPDERIRVRVTQVNEDAYAEYVGKTGRLVYIDQHDVRATFLVDFDGTPDSVPGSLWHNNVERLTVETETFTVDQESTFGEIPVGTVWKNVRDGSDQPTVWTKTDDTHYRHNETNVTHQMRRQDYPVRIVQLANVSESANSDSEPTTFTAEQVAEQVRQAKREARQEAERRFEDWKRNAEETAHRYAENNNLCSEFDRCMVEIGLEPREGALEEDYAVTFTIHVTASDPDSAVELAREESLRYADVEDVEAI